MQLHCLVWGWPSPAINWFREGVAINVSMPLVTSSNSSSLYPNDLLQLNEMTMDLRGNYTCVVHNTINGSLYTDEAAIIVRTKGKRKTAYDRSRLYVGAFRVSEFATISAVLNDELKKCLCISYARLTT